MSWKERYEKLAVELALKFAEAIILRECDGEERRAGGHDKKGHGDVRGERRDRHKGQDGGCPATWRLSRSDRIKVIADDTLKEPGFTIETRVGDIDGRISSQLEELRSALTGDHE